MSASQENVTKKVDASAVGFIVSLHPTTEEKSHGLRPFFTSNGNRITLTSREAELYFEYIASGEKGSLEQHRVILEKVMSGFRSKVDNRMAALQYEPLPTSSSIRLVRILSPADDGMIRLSMETHNLDENMPSYECLSYTWGNPHSRLPGHDFYEQRQDSYGESALWPIECNKQLLWVRRNLFDALRQMPRSRLWAGTDDEMNEIMAATSNDKSAFISQATEINDMMTNLDPLHETHGSTVLMLAASKGYTNLCRMLIKTGHDPYEKDLNGRTAFDYALENGHVALNDVMVEQINKAASGGRHIWIDAICINQQDLSERSSQVRLMSKLYSEAENVILWLGTPDPLTQIGIRALAKLGPALARGKLLQSKVIPFAPYDQAEAFKDAGIPNIDDIEWAGLASIYLRQYFRRVWSLQEAVLARSTVAFVGDAEISWDALLFLAHELKRMEKYNGRSFSTSFRLHHGLHVEHEAETIWKHRMRRQLDATTQEEREQWFQDSDNTFNRGTDKPCREPLLDIVLHSATLECHDPRDRIYGLLGIAGDHPESPQVVPDYNKPLAELWAQVTRQYIEASDGKDSKHLDILNLMRDTALTLREDLPSWVPDYGFIGVAPLGTSDFCADGGIGHTPHGGDAWNRLTVRGIKLDTIDATARPRDLSLKVTKFDLDPTWFSLILNMDPVHGTGQSRTEVLWRTLCGDQLAAAIQDFGRGTSPAPSRYGKQFTDLICAMVLRASDVKAEAEGRPKASDSLMIEMLTASSRLALTEAQENVSTITPDLTVDLLLMMSMMQDPDVEEVVNALCELAEDEGRFTPTVQDIIAYIRKPTYRLVHGDGRQNDGLGFMALDRKDGGFVERFSAIYGYRRLFLTGSRHLGLGPASLEIGDEVWVLAGAKAPFILRPTTGSDSPTYKLIGEAYVHGFMHGEAVSQATSEFTSIVLE